MNTSQLYGIQATTTLNMVMVVVIQLLPIIIEKLRMLVFVKIRFSFLKITQLPLIANLEGYYFSIYHKCKYFWMFLETFFWLCLNTRTVNAD